MPPGEMSERNGARVATRERAVKTLSTQIGPSLEKVFKRERKGSLKLGKGQHLVGALSFAYRIEIIFDTSFSDYHNYKPNKTRKNYVCPAFGREVRASANPTKL